MIDRVKSLVQCERKNSIAMGRRKDLRKESASDDAIPSDPEYVARLFTCPRQDKLFARIMLRLVELGEIESAKGAAAVIEPQSIRSVSAYRS